MRVRTARRVALVSAIAIAITSLAGPRVYHAYRELRCPEGQGAMPVSIAPVYVCRPQIEGVAACPHVIAVEDRTALYLANARIRVFDIDRVWGTTYFLAWNVPPGQLGGRVGLSPPLVPPYS